MLPPRDERGVIAELLRVAKPGGHIVLVDTDWGSAAVDFSDTPLERRLMHFFATRMRPNGFAGRRLYPLCREFALHEVSIDTFPLVHYRFDETPFNRWLLDTALAAAVLTVPEATAWRDELTQRDHDGRFIATVNMVVVAARTPAAP